MKTTQTYETNHQKLLLLMQQAGLTSLSQLSEISGVSQWQLNRLLVGLILKMPLETLVNIAKALQVSLEQLLNEFAGEHTSSSSSLGQQENPQELESLKREYQSLQDQLDQQKQILEKEFQQSSLEVLESWLLQWPTAAVVAKKNPQLSAVKLLPLVKPITELLKQWNVETNATVGEKVPYDPQIHQLLEGSGEVEPGDMVMVRYVGYCQGEKLLYRAKVSPVKQEGES
ncbi:transcriptional regulator, XRE family [Rippkaea orientalis PCC 8801]|uniref:Transcriptional regulator, XRE family n=1 Tax=Rippkaea orientalis (strain PCC 8801 / RF-1) TaxID=41431 RepID=B7JZ78_RIPO1|nr:helix-turn-helix transcriptional regulator [Rippkaea orientalis]ACK67289.1 transcriptional regulator, XRE family [Rippkaea orientalis PCC 8801]